MAERCYLPHRCEDYPDQCALFITTAKSDPALNVESCNDVEDLPHKAGSFIFGWAFIHDEVVEVQHHLA